MVFGTAVHVATLEAEAFPDRYHVMPKVDRRTTIGKAAYAAALNEAEGKVVLPETGKFSYEYACQMGQSLHEPADIQAESPGDGRADLVTIQFLALDLARLDHILRQGVEMGFVAQVETERFHSSQQATLLARDRRERRGQALLVPGE